MIGNITLVQIELRPYLDKMIVIWKEKESDSVVMVDLPYERDESDKRVYESGHHNENYGVDDCWV